jgi:transcription elongation factor Elf1
MTIHRKAWVTCQACAIEHEVTKVETLNIEEDSQGRDRVTFECPVCDKQRLSLVVIHF